MKRIQVLNQFAYTHIHYLSLFSLIHTYTNAHSPVTSWNASKQGVSGRGNSPESNVVYIWEGINYFQMNIKQSCLLTYIK